jgi:hypothetical protein
MLPAIVHPPIGIVQKRPDGLIPGSKSWTWLFRSPTAPSNRSIQAKPNEAERRRPSVAMYCPFMKRMSASNV